MITGHRWWSILSDRYSWKYSKPWWREKTILSDEFTFYLTCYHKCNIYSVCVYIYIRWLQTQLSIWSKFLIVQQTFWTEQIPFWSAESTGRPEEKRWDINMDEVFSSGRYTEPYIFVSHVMKLFENLRLEATNEKSFRYCKKRLKKLNPGFALLHFCRSLSVGHILY